MIVTIEMEQGGIIKIELDETAAPNTVKNFASLAKAGFYDGLIFSPCHPRLYDSGGRSPGRGHRRSRLQH